tara:strand:+ start:2178 stop:3740 length:1563 start_codon:yes stop_codon:yes gene_type:complete
MARNRVIYQSEALFVGPDATSGHYNVPTGLNIKRVVTGAGGVYTSAVIDMRTSKVAANTAGTNNAAVSNTAVTLSGIYTRPALASYSNGQAFAGARRAEYSSIKANFGAIASNSVDGVVNHNGSPVRITGRAFPASGSKLIAQSDGDGSEGSTSSTGIALMLPHPLTVIPVSGYSGASSIVKESGFTGYLPVTNRVNQLIRVQSANYGFDIGRTDVNQFGNLAAIDRIILEQPTVNLDFTYLLTDGTNEDKLGFGINGEASAVGNFLSGIGDSRNYWVYVASEGNDANEANTTINNQAKSIGIGNGFLTSYTAEGSVGDFPTASLNAEALNMRFFAKNSGDIPAVEPVNGTNYSGSFQLPAPKTDGGIAGTAIKALRPGDVTMNISGTKGVAVSDLKLQNFSFNFDMAREPLNKLGSKFAFSREISFPVVATCSADAILGEIEAGNLADVVADDSTEFTVRVKINQPGTSNTAIQYDLKGCKLESQSFTSSIGDNKAVSLEWATQVGGPQDTTHGITITT